MTIFWINSSYFTLPFGSIFASLKRSSTAINHIKFSVQLYCYVIGHWDIGGWGSPEVFPECPVDYLYRHRNQTVNRPGQHHPLPLSHSNTHPPHPSATWRPLIQLLSSSDSLKPSHLVFCIWFERKCPISLVSVFPEISGMGFTSHSSPSQLIRPPWQLHPGPPWPRLWPALASLPSLPSWHVPPQERTWWQVVSAPITSFFFKVCV